MPTKIEEADHPHDSRAKDGPLQEPCSACLCIGGPEDGKLWTIPKLDTRFRTLDRDGSKHDYRKELIGTPGKTWRVFVYEPLTMTTAMDMLIAGYKPNAKNQTPPPMA